MHTGGIVFQRHSIFWWINNSSLTFETPRSIGDTYSSRCSGRHLLHTMHSTPIHLYTTTHTNLFKLFEHNPAISAVYDLNHARLVCSYNIIWCIYVPGHVHVLFSDLQHCVIYEKFIFCFKCRAHTLTSSCSGSFFSVRAFNILNEITWSSLFHRFECYLRIISTLMDFYSLELIKGSFSPCWLVWYIMMQIDAYIHCGICTSKIYYILVLGVLALSCIRSLNFRYTRLDVYVQAASFAF